MASDVAEARPLSAGSGKGQRLKERVARGRTTRGPPIKRSRLPDLWLMIEKLGALDGARSRRDRGELSPDGST